MIALAPLIEAARWFFLGYFVLINLACIALILLSMLRMPRHIATRFIDDLPQVVSGFEPPVSILVPACNEEATIAASVRSMLQLDYPAFEVIVVNDGSRDGTLRALMQELDLAPCPEACWRQLEVRPVRGIYRSRRHPALRVIDKDNGGKADALNAAINASCCPLVCGVDADSILERRSLRRVVAPFLYEPDVVASGGTIRIASGCAVVGGYLERIGLPRRLLPLLQIVEYLRAFLFGRPGWAALNAVLIISGAFGVFRKEAVIAAGGYRHKTIGQDTELIVRLHRINRLAGKPCRIEFLPEPVCWTEAPESLRVLRSQRTRWQRGLAESLTANAKLLFNRRGGAPGWIAFLFMIVFEWFGPLIEVAGYLFMVAGFLLGATALLENFGYRQLISLWRLQGLAQWALGTRQRWGEMTRSASRRKLP